MQYGEALSAKPKGMKMPKNELRGIMLKKSENGGVIAEHHMSNWDGKPEPVHTFGPGEGGKLAQHITEHLGMQIPGNHADGQAESAE